MNYMPIPPCMMWYQGAMIEEGDDRDLEMLYPQIYFRVMPLVMHHCDQMESRHGVMYSPTRNELSRITDDIENRLNDTMGNISGEETRQFGGGFLGDLASILLLRELTRRRRGRRRRPFFY
ncbi:hypothetical protein [Candidatus Clostridium stratigraminis]|uniref:Uncharacterized protein n=1 Tax=Candidatus Clostridium stratigraminis TaxID=3381661 RepID=A0ABW8T3N4_9CLOT